MHSSSHLLRCVYYLRFVKNRVYFTFITLSSKSLTFNWIFLVRVFGFVTTMPCCVVPGCTSGYASNPERVNFFTISKREFFDTDGRVIGVISTIKCIYLYWNCFDLKRFHIIVIVVTSVQNTTFKARQCAINFFMVRGNMSDTRWTVVPCARCTQWSLYKWDCTLRCLRRWGSVSIPKSCSECKKCMSPEFVRILSTAELSLPSGWVITSHEMKASKLFILFTHKNIKKD